MSSSSSSSDKINSQLTFPLINQNNGDLILFSWVSELGVTSASGSDSILNFTIEASNSPYFDYSAILNRDNSAVTANTSSQSIVYIPNDAAVEYKHEKSIYVDVIATDSSGIRDVQTHVGVEKYGFVKAEDIGQTFCIPRFTWK